MIYSSFPAYTEDISVAGSLLIDKISVLYESITKRGKQWYDYDMRSALRILFKVSNVELVDRLGVEPNIIGTLHVTTSHVIFRSDNGGKELWIANGLIGSVERGSLSAAGCPLVIRCKHFQVINLLIGRDKICQDLYETLLRCSKVGKSFVFRLDSYQFLFVIFFFFRNQGMKMLYSEGRLKELSLQCLIMMSQIYLIFLVNVCELVAFENRDVAEDARGWSRLDWGVEFTRQGVDGEWAENDLNESYRSCDTYPERLWLPVSANKTILMGSCRFRSRGRLPVLTYFYKPNGAAICRCAQPLTGFSARCVEDEKLMGLIGKANKNFDTLFLVDTRPIMNAMVNKVQGKGFEDERNYSNTRFHFFDIENIHVMRSSQIKLLEACTKSRTVANYLRSLESSGWLKHLRAIVECSTFLADSISKGISCVVHCSDGWDRTSQTVSLAQLLLDPFFRTIHGFQVLIEKDWLGFGHKFDDRCAHVGALNDEAAKEISPIFSQFLDCVHQIMRQRPRAFQFNDRYLIDIHEHVYSCQFGTFIGNCEKDRKASVSSDLQLAKRTKSLWTYLDLRLDDYFNPFYEPTTFSVLSGIDTRAAAFIVWHALYNRFDDGLLPRETVIDTVMTTMEHVGVLESHITALRMRIAELKCFLGRGGAYCGNSMADSGHSSGTGQSEERLASDQRPPSRESGIYEQGLAYSVFCRRCVRVTADERERICEGCRGI
uniref:Phosphatidylinositol-3-phosphatase n=1 Tax=Angiostrongylus cantonensis TaxID=6313 RepID=A0A158P5Z0_ANGCA